MRIGRRALGDRTRNERRLRRLGGLPCWALGVAFAGLAGAASCAEAARPATVDIDPPRERRLDSREHPGHRFTSRTANFSFGGIPYSISYQACVDPAHGGKASPLEGYIGMPQPAACNWYHSGFLFVVLDGRDIGGTPLSSMLVAESGKRAILDMVWHDPAADVRARFLGLPGRDCLFCEVAVEPRQEMKSLALRLRCYPSFFTAYHKREGARRVQTPAVLVKQGEKPAPLPAKDNGWAVYYDEVFDVAKGEGEGPCAVLVLPEAASEISIAPGGYSVETQITCPPQTRRIRMAFWDFKGRTNAEALARLRDGADAVRKELAALDFTPPRSGSSTSRRSATTWSARGLPNPCARPSANASPRPRRGSRGSPPPSGGRRARPPMRCGSLLA